MPLRVKDYDGRSKKDEEQVSVMAMKMRHSILIVDDEKIIRECMAMALSHAYKTYQAANGREAIDIINMNRDIRVVISDLKMPEMDGFALLEKIRNENKKVQVIFVTAYFPIESEAHAMRMGVFDFMTKPVDLDELETTIQSAIARNGYDGKTKKLKEALS